MDQIMYKLIEENIGKKLIDIGLANNFLKRQKHKRKKSTSGITWNSKASAQQKKQSPNEKATYEIGKNIWKSCMW